MELEEFELVVTVARKIWLHRNTIVFGGELSPPAQVILKCDGLWLISMPQTKRNNEVQGVIISGPK